MSGWPRHYGKPGEHEPDDLTPCGDNSPTRTLNLSDVECTRCRRAVTAVRKADGPTATEYLAFLSLDEVQGIVEHLIEDGTREGLILGNLLNVKAGASARRRIERGELP